MSAFDCLCATDRWRFIDEESTRDAIVTDRVRKSRAAFYGGEGDIYDIVLRVANGLPWEIVEDIIDRLRKEYLSTNNR